MDDAADAQESKHWQEDEEPYSPAMASAGLGDKVHVHKTTVLQAHRALLEKPYISSNDEEYFLIKTQFDALKTWHRSHTGWHIERRKDLFRLLRQPCMLTSGERESKLFMQTARDFVYVLWILWYAANDQIAKRGNGQLFLLGQMLERLSEEWMMVPSMDVLTLGGQLNYSEQPIVIANRKCMARALKYLQALGCLKEVDGQIDTWVEQDEPVLYQFTNAVHLLIMSLDPGAFRDALAHQKASTIFTEALIPVHKEKCLPLTRAWRALLLGPFLLRYDDDEAFKAITAYRVKMRHELETSFGWSLEVNHDYACIIRDISSSPSSSLHHSRSTHDHVVLLLCKKLREQVAAGMLRPDYYGRILTTVAYLQELLASLRARFEQYWSKGVRDKRDKELLLEALGKMRRNGLIRGPDSKDEVLILPPAARYSPRYAESVDEQASSRHTRKAGEEQDGLRQTNLWTDEKAIDEY